MKTLLAITVSLIAAQTFALPKYRAEFVKNYPQVSTVTCKMCHDAPKSLNPYGQDVKKSGINFKSIEALDSDGDSYTNIEEINANSMPGDKDSTPSRP
jgi:hypothetical protein